MNRGTGNHDMADYRSTLRTIADTLAHWRDEVVLVAHEDPDGDALGATVALSRALRRAGKRTHVPLEAPDYLRFLLSDDDLSPPLTSLPQGALLVALDVGELDRVAGAPTTGAARTLNIDHHGSNDRFGDIALVQPSAAATCVIVKDLIDALALPWSEAIATPCLTGILTDTGLLSYGNVDPQALRTVAELLPHAMPYAELTEALQSRPPGYFPLLGAVMSTVRFPLQGRVAVAHRTLRMKEVAEEVDSDDFVGQIRYARGTLVAVLLKEAEDGVKLSVRARAPVSAQRICAALGGGGHVAAAGAKLSGADLAAAEAAVLHEIATEFGRLGSDAATHRSDGT